MTIPQQDLDALREAARGRHADQCQFLLKKLMLSLEFYIGLSVAVERAHKSLHVIERHYPAEKWPRQLLVQIASTGTAPGQMPDAALQEHTAPGAANYIKCLSDLSHAVQPGPQPPRVGHMVSAVVNAITAELVEMWYRDRAEDWERFRNAQINPSTGQYDDPAVTRLAIDFWTDPAVAAQDTALWLSVADALADRFKRQSSS